MQTSIKKRRTIKTNRLDLVSLSGNIDFGLIKSALLSEDFERVLKAFEFYKLADTQISSEIFKRRVYVSGLPLYFTSENKEQEKFLNRLFQRSDFKNLIFDLSGAISYGFMAFVKNYKLDDGIIVPDFKALDARYFRSDETGELYLKQGTDKIYLDDPRLFVYYHGADSGEGLRSSLMYKILVIASLKYLTISRFMSYFDSLAVPPLVVKTNMINDEKQAMELIDAAVGLRSNGVGLFDKEDILELLNSTSSKESFMSFINYCDECIAKSITGQLLAGNALTHGTQALGKVHNEIRQDILRYDAGLISTALAKIIKEILELNFASAKAFDFRLDSNMEADEEKLSIVYERISNMGFVIPDEFMEQTFRIKGLKKASNLQAQSSVPELNSSKRQIAQGGKPLDNIEAAINSKEFNDKQKAILKEINQALNELLTQSLSYEEAFSKLYKMYDDAPLEILEEAMSEALSNASIYGASYD